MAIYYSDGEQIDALTTFYMKAKTSRIINQNFQGTKQGACIGGNNIYQAALSTNGVNVLKYNMNTSESNTVFFDNSVTDLGHANDMAYNPYNSTIAICTMKTDGAVVILSADDLSFIKSVNLVRDGEAAHSTGQICYDRLQRYYYVVNGSNYDLYNDDWEYVKSIPYDTYPDATFQGCETDGEYIYRIFYDPNCIDIMTVDGQKVKTMELLMTGEPETMLYDWNGNYYVNRNYLTLMEIFSVRLKHPV